MKLRNLITLVFLSAVAFGSCTKEDMIGPDPSFSTSLIDATATDATAYAGEAFWVKVKRTNSEFYSLYKGETGSIFGVQGAKGETFSITTDSLSVTYKAAGTYILTIVASSAGNQAADYDQKVDSITINVLDRRTAFESFVFYQSATEKVSGVITESEEGNTIFGEAADYPGRNYTSKPIFSTKSPNAEVYLVKDGVETLLISNKTDVDFSTADVKPLLFRVKPPFGDVSDFTVTLAKKEPSKEAVIGFVQILKGTSVLDLATRVLIPGSVPERYALDMVCTKTDKTKTYKLKISSSYASTVKLQIAITKNKVTTHDFYVFIPNVAYDIKNIETIRVIPENQKDSIDYEFKLFDPVFDTTDKAAFQFVEGKNGAFNPLLNGDVDMTAKTISFFMSKSGYGDNFKALKAKWKTSATNVTVDGVDVTSGVTTFDFTGDPEADVWKKKFTFLLNYTPFDFDVVINLTE